MLWLSEGMQGNGPLLPTATTKSVYLMVCPLSKVVRRLSSVMSSVVCCMSSLVLCLLSLGVCMLSCAVCRLRVVLCLLSCVSNDWRQRVCWRVYAVVVLVEVVEG